MKITVKRKQEHHPTVTYEVELSEDGTEFTVKEFIATAETFMKMLIHGRMPAIRTMGR